MDWGVACRTAVGETDTGDHHVVRPFPGGVLVGVVDGLGHGPEAAAAALAAVAVLEQQPEAPVLWLVRRCHEAITGTRGVVMSLASFNTEYGTLSWIGVGNVEAVLLRKDPAVRPAREFLLLRGGVVGYQLPPLSADAIPVSPGDTLVLATDGVRNAFATQLRVGDPPQKITDRILAEYATGTDDALVLAAEFRGDAR
jgi:negative regulator of sigma-B (phosphoserine phosphatase)